MNNPENFTIGFIWGLLLSIPLWVSILGWMELAFGFLKSIFILLPFYTY
jgi:hypothetical protein